MKIHLVENVHEDLYGYAGDWISPEEYFSQLASSIRVEVDRDDMSTHINKARDLILIDHSGYPRGYDITKQDALKPGWHATVEWDDPKHRSIHLRTYLNGVLDKTIPFYVSGYRPSAAGDMVARALR